MSLERKCPQCKVTFTPVLAKQPIQYMNWQMGDLIQVAFPFAKSFEREQLLTGICSDKCWDDYFAKEIQS